MPLFSQAKHNVISCEAQTLLDRPSTASLTALTALLRRMNRREVRGDEVAFGRGSVRGAREGARGLRPRSTT